MVDAEATKVGCDNFTFYSENNLILSDIQTNDVPKQQRWPFILCLDHDLDPIDYHALLRGGHNICRLHGQEEEDDRAGGGGGARDPQHQSGPAAVSRPLLLAGLSSFQNN